MTEKKIYTEIDEQGRSWVVVEGVDADHFLENSMEMIGGIPDTWKRR